MTPEKKVQAKDLVDKEMVEVAEASAAARKEKMAKEADNVKGVGVLRRTGGVGTRYKLTESDIPYPAEVHGDDFEFYGPSGFGATIPEGTDIVGYSSEQEFIIDPDRVVHLMFDRPNRNLPKKRLYTVKAIHKDGRLVQLGFEDQIQNTAGGDPEDAIGLRRYVRKGIFLLIDWSTLIPVYCAAWGCWAQGSSSGFCSERHAMHTMPNRFKDAANITRGLMEAGVTTTRTWGV